MRLYDEIIDTIFTLTKDKKDITESIVWDSSDPNQMIFKSDAAFELGGAGNAASGLFLTDASFKDGVYLLGKDIPDLKEDTHYARITIVSVDDSKMGSGTKLYQKIRQIDYAKYHVFPKDCMLRISQMNQKESLLVGKNAKKNKLTFAKLGNLFIEEYKKIDAVHSVIEIFIIDASFPYAELEACIRKTEGITKALDHLLNKVSMDCHACNLKEVCDEVEELVKEDFKDE